MSTMITITTPIAKATQTAVCPLSPFKINSMKLTHLTATAIDATRNSADYCSNAAIIDQLNTCLRTFDGDDDEDWGETHDDVLQGIARVCGQNAEPGMVLTVPGETATATATGAASTSTGSNDDDDNDNNGVATTTVVGPSVTGSNANDDDDDGMTTPTTSLTMTVGGPTSTATTGSQSDNNDEDNDNDDGGDTNAGSSVHAGVGSVLVVVLVTLAM